ncbi:MAG: DUF3658 domain-containing protein [Candidatus Avoscillospira sp.]
MIEITFSDSACGGLKMAMGFGKGPYKSGCIGVIVSHEDGSPATEAEIEAARREAEEQARKDWEQAVPMDGRASDVFGFPLALSMGDISEDVPGPQRQRELRRLYDSVFPGEPGRAFWTGLEENLKTVRDRAASGEDVRIWYSDNPDELCGLYWFLTQLPKTHGRVWLLKLPDWEVRADGTMAEATGWGEVAPGEFGRYLPLQKAAPEIFCRRCAARWKELQEENAPLRAVVSRWLTGVPEDFYDHFIRREIDAEQPVFQEARLIGNLLGKYPLGVGDFWMALRIEEMLRQGRLQAVTEARADEPVYWRTLRK